MNGSADNEEYRIFYADLVIDRTYTGHTFAELNGASELIIKYMNFVADLEGVKPSLKLKDMQTHSVYDYQKITVMHGSFT